MGVTVCGTATGVARFPDLGRTRWQAAPKPLGTSTRAGAYGVWVRSTAQALPPQPAADLAQDGLDGRVGHEAQESGIGAQGSEVPR